MKTGQTLKPLSLYDALLALEKAARDLAKKSRWYPYGSQMNELRVPLAQIRMARANSGRGIR